MTAKMDTNIQRITLYWHNGRGLGHLVRSGALGQAFLDQSRPSAVVGITGSQKGFELLPLGMDFVKVPSYISYDAPSGGKRVPVMPISEEELYQTRAAIFESFLLQFRPHALITDLYPLGKKNELLHAMAQIPETRKIYGIRGILDETVFAPGTGFFDQETINFVGKHFAGIHVYTDPKIFRLEDHYRLPKSWLDMLQYTGYITRPIISSKEEARRLLGLDAIARIIMVSFGAGRGKGDMWQGVLPHLLQLKNHFDVAYLVGGINLEEDTYNQISNMVAEDPRFHLTRMLPDLPTWMKASDLHIGAGGYNSCAEVLASRTNALVIPSEWNDLEEEISTQRMADLKLVRKRNRDKLMGPEVTALLEECLFDPYPHVSAPEIMTDGATQNAKLVRSYF